jgi:hypothetical protein
LSKKEKKRDRSETSESSEAAYPALTPHVWFVREDREDYGRGRKPRSKPRTIQVPAQPADCDLRLPLQPVTLHSVAVATDSERAQVIDEIADLIAEAIYLDVYGSK